MRMRRYAWMFAAILALVAIVLIRGDGKRGREQVVRIGYLPIVASLPLYIAEEEKFFEQEGIRVEAIPLSSSNQLVDGIVSGNLDCVVESSAVPVLAAELQSPGKSKIFAVSEITNDKPFDAILVKDESQIAALMELAGKKIGVFPGSTATTLLRKFLHDQGVDTSEISFLPLPPENQLAALAAGTIDALHAYEPAIAIALSTSATRKLFGSVYAAMLSPNLSWFSVKWNFGFGELAN